MHFFIFPLILLFYRKRRKRTGHSLTAFSFSAPPSGKASQSSRPQARIRCRFVPRGGVYLTRNTRHTASVEFVCLRHTNYARSRVHAHSNANPTQWFAFEACQKDFLTRASAPPGAAPGGACRFSTQTALTASPSWPRSFRAPFPLRAACCPRRRCNRT